jgi:DNA-3-methyladenine glycosylase II
MEHISHLNKDKKLAKVLKSQAPFELSKRNHIHLQLCSSIMSQQLSTKVAAVIYERFLQLFTQKNPTPHHVLEIPFEDLRAIGLSNSKTHYVRNVCEFFIEQKLSDAKLHRMSDEELLTLLTQIKGVGQWTVEMLLMFAFGREDVFSHGDFGIQQAMIRLYELDPSDKKALKKEMLQLSKKWSPYRTYACRYLWNWKDGK